MITKLREKLSLSKGPDTIPRGLRISIWEIRKPVWAQHFLRMYLDPLGVGVQEAARGFVPETRMLCLSWLEKQSLLPSIVTVRTTIRMIICACILCMCL